MGRSHGAVPSERRAVVPGRRTSMQKKSSDETRLVRIGERALGALVSSWMALLY